MRSGLTITSKNSRGGRFLLAWLAVALCVLAILAAAPTARLIQRFISQRFGRALFGYAVLAVVAAVYLFLVGRQILRRKHRSPLRLAWLTLISALYVFLTLRLWSNPEEAVHFLEYGVLGYFLFRALRFSIPDVLVYAAAVCLGAFVGLADEVLQWVLPDRIWDFRDVGLNVLAVGLVQAALALGIRPAGLAGRVSPRSVRLVSSLAAGVLLFVGLCLSNTPEAVDSYTRLWPILLPLRDQEPMREVLVRYDDPRAGRFYSRLSREWLEKTDLSRADEFGRILRDRRGWDYGRFLRVYTQAGEPFLHEFRVRIFRRDKMEERYRTYASERGRRRALLAAVGENMVLEGYFRRTLSSSGYSWSLNKKKELESLVDPSLPTSSPVGVGILTRVSTSMVWAAVGLLWLLLIVINVLIARAGRRSRPAPEDAPPPALEGP